MNRAQAVVLPFVVALGCGADEVRADICEAVLQHRAFNVSDSTINANLRASVLDELCKTKWSSRSEFENRAKNLNTSGKYVEVFSGRADAATNESRQAMEEDYDNLCTKKDYRTVSSFFAETKIQSADVAVAAWKDCVLGRDGLRSAISRTPDSNRFIIQIYFKAPATIAGGEPPKLKLTGFSSGAGYDCTLNNGPVSDVTLVALGMQNALVSCWLTGDESAQVYINTNWGGGETVGPYLVASATYEELQRKQDELQRQLDRLRAALPVPTTTVVPITAKNVRRPGTTNVFEGRCDRSTPKVVSGGCISQDGNAALQNFGPENDPDGIGKWVCVWGRAMSGADVVATCTK